MASVPIPDWQNQPHAIAVKAHWLSESATSLPAHTRAALGQPASRAFRSSGSAEPQLAAPTDTSSGSIRSGHCQINAARFRRQATIWATFCAPVTSKLINDLLTIPFKEKLIQIDPNMGCATLVTSHFRAEFGIRRNLNDRRAFLMHAGDGPKRRLIRPLSP